MFDSWSFKRKNVAFLAAVGVILVLGYFLSVARTLSLRKQNTTLIQRQSNADQRMARLSVLRQQKEYIDSVRQTFDLAGGDQLLLRQLTQLTGRSSASLAEYAEVQKRSTRERFSLYKFEGVFSDLVRLLYDVEQRRLGGGIASVKFQQVTNRRTRREQLFMELYFEEE
ncbi:MAG: hypothetical protein AAGA85_21195 [Bacteroidota bacterium]